MRNMIENYINGNLTDAKRLAKRHSWAAIFAELRESWGYTEDMARTTADYLKGKGSYQAACDAQFRV